MLLLGSGVDTTFGASSVLAQAFLSDRWWRAMLFRHLVLCLALGAGHGWWKQADSKEESAWRTWTTERFPTATEYYDLFKRGPLHHDKQLWDGATQFLREVCGWYSMA